MIENYSLKPHNTLALPARARYFERVVDVSKLPELAAFAATRQLPIFVLGGGSNVVLGCEVDALVLQVGMLGISVEAESPEQVMVRVAAGENWHGFVQHCLTQGWYGLENLALIPGTVGAAPVQNIGAYGVEVGEFIESVTVYDLHQGQWLSLDGKRCGFSYRNSLFKAAGQGTYFISDVVFCLHKSPRVNVSYAPVAHYLADHQLSETPEHVYQAVVSIRRSKLPDPEALPNAGSFFKNPVVSADVFADLKVKYKELPHYRQANGEVKLAAGWLIEHCGFKGKADGPVAMHSEQALVMVNQGDATVTDVTHLALSVQTEVYRQFGVKLEVEPVFMPASSVL